MTRVLSGLLLAVSLSACTFGKRAESLPLAMEPRGASVTVRTRMHAERAELLAVQDTAFVILSEAQRVTLVPYRVVHEAVAEVHGTFAVQGRTLGRTDRDRLRRISRYPQGLSPELLRALLAAYRQPALEVMSQ